MQRVVFVILLFAVLIGSVPSSYAGRLYDPVLMRFTTPDPALKDKLPSELMKINNSCYAVAMSRVYISSNPRRSL
jgi:hypothetical protein